MGVLMDKLNLSLLVNGNGVVDNFKNNSLFFYESYQKSTESIENIAISDIYPGNFYFLHYYDDSNWMKYSPVFVVDYKINTSVVKKYYFYFTSIITINCSWSI